MKGAAYQCREPLALRLKSFKRYWIPGVYVYTYPFFYKYALDITSQIYIDNNPLKFYPRRHSTVYT